MMNTPSTIQLSKKESQLPSAFCKVARGVFTTCSPRMVNVNVPATPPNCIVSLSSPIGKLCTDCSFRKVVCRAKMLLVDRMRHACVQLQSKGHTEYLRQIYDNIYIYMKIVPFNSLVWGSLRLTPITTSTFQGLRARITYHETCQCT